MNTSSERIVFRDYPFWIWVVGAGTIAIAIYFQETVWEKLLFSLAGAALFAFAPILTVSVDRLRSTLYVRYRSMLRRATKDFSFSDIGFIRVAEDWEGERMYRVELVLRSGQAVPLRSYYSIGKRKHKRHADRILAALSDSPSGVTSL